jgi:tetratricopeptide (TPR) repeat protein
MPDWKTSLIFPRTQGAIRMNKILLTIVLGSAVAAVAQDAAQPATAQPAQSPAPQAAAPAQKKEIKDPAEYNAYMGAVGQTDPTAKISGLEAFLTQYPNSVMKEDALETLMGTYQQKGDVAKMGDTAQRLLQANPNNIKALAIVTYSKLAANNLAEADQNGQKCIAALPNAPKPDNSPAEEWEKTKTQIGGICYRAVGLAALGNKDYPKAATALHSAVEAAPNDVNVIYPLSQAYLKQTPPDTLNGLWFTARAAGLAPTPQGQQQIEKYGASVYRKYHGSDQGWTDLLAQAKSTPFPPADLSTKITQYVPPTPAEQAADLVKTKKVEEMSFAEWELVLSEGKPEDAEKVWNTLKGKPLQMAAQVMEVTSSSNLKLAGSSDDIDAKKPDIDLTMTAAIPARLMPKVGADFQFEGTPVSYEPKPFVMTMKDGAILTAKAPAGAKKPAGAVHKKPASQQ